MLDVFCMSRVDPKLPIDESVGGMADQIRARLLCQVWFPLAGDKYVWFGSIHPFRGEVGKVRNWRVAAVHSHRGEGPLATPSRPPALVSSVMCGRPRRSKGDLVCCAAVGCGHVFGLRCAALGPLALMQFAAWLPNRFTRWNGA